MAFFSNDNDEIKSEIRALNKKLREQDDWYKEYKYVKGELDAYKNKVEELENQLCSERKKSEDLLKSVNHKHSENQRLHKKIARLKDSSIDEKFASLLRNSHSNDS